MSRALITGAAQGIGAALAVRCAGAGWEVVGVDVLDAGKGSACASWEVCDLAEPDDLEVLVARMAGTAPFDLVVHNAGLNDVGPFERTEAAAQARVIAVNLTAPMLLTAGLLRSGLVAPGGTLAFIASLSHQVGYPGAAVYAATKDGLTNYARSLFVALGPQDVNVLTVFPGPVRTEQARRASPADSDESKRMAPEVLATSIVKAVRQRRRVLVPGLGNKVFAFLGRNLPRLTERGMRKAIYDRLG